MKSSRNSFGMMFLSRFIILQSVVTRYLFVQKVVNCCYTINERYERAVVFIKSEAPKRNLRVFKWHWERELEHKRPFAVIHHWGRIPLDVEHYVLKNGQCNQ